MADNSFVVSKGITYSALAAAPSNPANGDTYYDSTLGKFRKYENGAWSDWSATSGGISSVPSGSAITGNYTVLSADNGRVLNVDTSSSSISIQLPTPTASFKLTIKDYKGNSATNKITVNRAGSELMDNTSSNDEIKVNFRAVTFLSDGTNWFRITEFEGLAPESLAIGLFMGGYTASATVVNNIDRVLIATLGNATDFGDLSTVKSFGGAVGSSTRAVHGGGYDGAGVSNVIDYVAFSTLGNAVDFGDLTVARQNASACSNSTRGIWMGGTGSDVMDYITIASTGNATDFGDLTEVMAAGCSLASPTRGIKAGGNNGTAGIDYITIATTGNATNFGNLSYSGGSSSGSGSSTRGLISGGFDNVSTPLNNIEYITYATTGNSVDFGDLTVTKYGPGGCSSTVRSLCAGGANPGTASSNASNIIDYVAIATLGNATDFGDLTQPIFTNGCSNAHGGL